MLLLRKYSSFQLCLCALLNLDLISVSNLNLLSVVFATIRSLHFTISVAKSVNFVGNQKIHQRTLRH